MVAFNGHKIRFPWLGRSILIAILIPIELTVVSCALGADCVVAPTGLVGWWPGDGSPRDIAGTNNGILNQGASTDTIGVVGSCFSFDGTNGYVEVFDSPLLDPSLITVEAWVLFNSLDSPEDLSSSGQQFIIWKANSVNLAEYALEKKRTPNGDVFSFQVSDQFGKTVEIESVSLISTSVWYHVAGMRGPSFVQLYVNGLSESGASVDFVQDYGSSSLYFGASENAGDQMFHGMLDEVSLYNRALSPTEVSLLYRAGAEGKCREVKIISQPQSQVVAAGTNIVLSTAATGLAPLAWQWRLNDTNVAGATSNILVLDDIQLHDSGPYTVTITNKLSSETSSVAILTVVPTQIEIPDTNLSNAVYRVLGKSTGQLTGLDLLSVTNLVALSQAITNLSGLEWALNLSTLSLPANAVRDVTLLANLPNLTALNLGDNLISDAAPLAGATNLTKLWLHGNSITNVTFVTNLTHLTLLSLAQNPISDLSPLVTATNLGSLILGQNGNADYLSLSSLTQLTNLTISGGTLTNLDFLNPLTLLTALNLEDDQITNLQSLTSLNQLKALTLSHNPITNPEVLSGLTNLTELEVDGDALLDLTWLGSLSQLVSLTLNDNDVQDLSPLYSLTNLIRLSLSGNRISSDSSLVQLAGLSELYTLDLGDNEISDLTFLQPLATSSNLAVLYVGRNLITNVAPLASLRNLRALDISQNRVQDISPLAGLPALKWVNLIWNFLGTGSDSNSQTVIDDLARRGTIVYAQPQHEGPRLALPTFPPTLSSSSLWGISAAGDSSIEFLVSDELSRPNDLQISVHSSNDSLIPDSNIVVTMISNTLTLAVTPVIDGNTIPGNTQLTVSLTDSSGLTTTRLLNVAVMWVTPVFINDPNLESAVCSSLDKPFGSLTSLDLYALTDLSARSSDIHSLSGLEWATNLTTLTVGGNFIDDLAPLMPLSQLTALSLENNYVADLSPLLRLPNISYLDLRWNWLTNTEVLAGFTNAKVLFLGGNSITNVAFLSKLTGLTALDLDHNVVRDLSPLTSLTNLALLDVSYNPLESAGQLSAFRGLTNLYASGNLISELRFCFSMHELRSLSLYSNNITDVIPLLGCKELTSLNLGQNPLVDPSSLCALTNLEALWMADSALSNSSWLACMPALHHLDLGNNNISDTSSLLPLWQLESLSLAFNSLTDLTALSSLTNLTYLNLNGALNASPSGIVVRDLSVVQPLSRLTVLSASRNQLTNLDVLAGLASLQTVDVRTNLLDLNDHSHATSIIRSLTNRFVNVLYDPQDQPPSFAFAPWPPTLSLYSSWAIPTGTVSSLTFYLSDDVTRPGALQVRATSLDPGVIDDSSISVVATNNIRTLTLMPVNIPGSVFLTITVTDRVGLGTNFTIRVDALAPEKVMFIDRNLDKAVRDVVAPQGADLTSVDLQNLTFLYAPAAGISNLSGLEWATNLTYLDLRGNNLSDISPIGNLTNLLFLRFHGDNAVDVSPLTGLSALKFLDISGNPATSLQVLSLLTNLSTLYLAQNSLTNISFLTNLSKLTVLNLETNWLTDVSPLANLPILGELFLGQNRLTDIAALTNLSQLLYLNVPLNLLETDLNPAIIDLENRNVGLIFSPQRTAPIIDVRTNWVVASHATSSLSFNIFDSGPANEVLGVGVGSGNPFLLAGLASSTEQDGASAWTVRVIPTGGPIGTTWIELKATNDVSLSASVRVAVVVTDSLPLDAQLLGESTAFWTSGGDAPWFGQGFITHSGHAVAESGSIGNNQQSFIQTTVNGPGRLSFWWKVSSESGYDWLDFTVAGQSNRISGNVDWQYQIANVPPGQQTLTWRYKKSGFTSAGLDAAWLDQVVFEPGVWLEITTPPTNGVCQLLLHAVTGSYYEVQASTNLAQDLDSTNWFPLKPFVNVTNSSFLFMDTNAGPGLRFYRLHEF